MLLYFINYFINYCILLQMLQCDYIYIYIIYKNTVYELLCNWFLYYSKLSLNILLVVKKNMAKRFAKVNEQYIVIYIYSFIYI